MIVTNVGKVYTLEYFQKQDPKMLFDLDLVSSETSEQTSKQKFALGLKDRPGFQ